jgi:hypothetical protein
MSAAGQSCERSFSPQGNWKEVPATQTQRVLREEFGRWGMPQRLRVDNGSPWGSSSDLPPDLALWLLGLGVDLHWNHPGQPQENGVIERSQGTAKRWAEPSACDSVEQLQANVDGVDRIQRESYPVAGGRSRLEAYPELVHSGRPYTPEWEPANWDLQRVLDHLSGYAVVRRVGPTGHLSLYNRRYYVGVIHRDRDVQVMFDPDQNVWLVTDDQGRLLNQLAPKEISEQRIRNLDVNRKETRHGRSSRKAKKRPVEPEGAAKQ